MFIGGTICLMVLIWTYGCESQVKSITNPIIFVNRGQLQIEVNAFIAQAELRFADLDRQDELKTTLFNTAIDFMQGGKINPVAVALVISSILGIGAGADNIRKRTHINTLKGNNANPVSPG
jgi:hypothetical protein